MKDLLTGVYNINGYTKKKTHPWKRHTIKTDLSERLNQSKKAQNKIDLPIRKIDPPRKAQNTNKPNRNKY